VELEAGVKLIIPVAAGKHPVSDNATYARRITRYRVHSGDTVQTVAENFGVSAQMVRRWNGLHNSDSLRGRKVLALHLPVTPSSEPATASKSSAHARKPAQTASKAPGGKSAKTAGQESSEQDTSGQAAVLRHTVKSGETLYSIATTYKTTVAALKRNNGNVAVLHPGMVLVVEPSR
jgi:LysM repeat protein